MMTRAQVTFKGVGRTNLASKARTLLMNKDAFVLLHSTSSGIEAGRRSDKERHLAKPLPVVREPRTSARFGEKCNTYQTYR